MQHVLFAWCRHCYRLAQRFLPGIWMVAALTLCTALANAAELITVNERLPTKAQNQQLHAAIAAHKGHPVLINFWASWCEPCREEMPALQRLADRWRDRGLEIITIAVADNPKQIKDYLREIAVQLPIIYDPEQKIIQNWGVRALPTTLILDSGHRIRLRGQGAINWDAVLIDQQFQPLFK